MQSANTSQMTNAASTGALAAAGTYVITRFIIKATPPLWRPALFSFIIEVATHWKDAPLQVKGQKGWVLPGQLGWYLEKDGFTMRTAELSGRPKGSEGFYQAAVSGVITAVVWYVAARGFFKSNHKQAMWYGGVFGLIGAYGGYLQGDQQAADKQKKGAAAIRLPFGGGYGIKA